MSANKSVAGLSLMQGREAERNRYFSGAHLKATGARLFLICRDCHRWREIMIAYVPDDLDVRFPEGRFRCVKCDCKTVVLGISRGPDDPGPPGIPGSEGFRKR